MPKVREQVTWAGVSSPLVGDKGLLRRCKDCRGDLPPRCIVIPGPRFLCAACAMSRAEHCPQVAEALERMRKRKAHR